VQRGGRQGTAAVLEFAKSCFGYETGVVEDIRGWKAGWEERPWGIVQASYAEKRWNGALVLLL